MWEDKFMIFVFFFNFQINKALCVKLPSPFVSVPLLRESNL